MLGVELAAALVIGCRPATPVGNALPSWAPDGKALAFSIPQEESASIAAARPGAAAPYVISASPDSAPVQVAWSPWGNLIAFVKRTGAIEVLFLGSPGFSTELVHQEYGKATHLGNWSPDGHRLVFARDGHIHTLDVTTREIHYLVDGNAPTWSPDGTEIAYALGNQLRGISPEGGPSRTIAVADTPIDDIAWSPDSSRLAFLGKAIGIVARSGGNPTYTAPALPPLAWRPNGIFYSLEQVALVNTRIWRLDPDTEKTSAVTHLPQGFNAFFLDASPDGRRIVYELENKSELPAGLRVVDADGRNDGPFLACHGTPRPDVVRGSRLNDVIRINGGGRDRVTCGRGYDVVYADRRDRVARDCERVTRSP